MKQNKYYKHTTIEEDTAEHQEFLTFNSYRDRIDFLHTAIKKGTIQGALTDSYHAILQIKGMTTAETFLTVHATALHVTPFGGCVHDFSQAPCPKHLQCWNDCSHLHLLGTPSEKKNLQEQADRLAESIIIMRDAGNGEAGSDVWLEDQEHKLRNLQKALASDVGKEARQVFPSGRPITASKETQRRSSVSEE